MQEMEESQSKAQVYNRLFPELKNKTCLLGMGQKGRHRDMISCIHRQYLRITKVRLEKPFLLNRCIHFQATWLLS